MHFIFKRNEKISIDNDFKDFLSIIQFSRIVRDLVKNNIIGIYNVSISKKIYLSEILYWLDKKFYKKLESIPRNSAPSRNRNRCWVTGRSRGFYRDFGLSRHVLREMSNEGFLPGVRKSSW